MYANVGSLIDARCAEIAAMTEREIRTWLIDGFANDGFAGFLPFEDLPLREQLRGVLSSCGEPTLGRVRSALDAAIREWSDPRVLRELAFLAADLEAYEITHTLQAVLDELLQNGDAAGSERRRTIGALVAVLGGLPLDRRPVDYLEDRYFRGMQDEFKAQLMNSLVEARPDEYTRYFREFAEAAQRRPNYFSVVLILRRLIDIVNFPIIGAHIAELSVDQQHLLADRASDLFYERYAQNRIEHDIYVGFLAPLVGVLNAEPAPHGYVANDRFVIDNMGLDVLVAQIQRETDYVRTAEACDVSLQSSASDLEEVLP